MPSLTIENYVKTIYQICGRQEGRAAGTGQLAESLSVSPGTVTSMLKTLKDTELAEYTPYEGVRLTEAGRRLALRVLRRHRLIELFLVETLSLNWDQVHEEAENMEHAVSDLLVDRMEEYLGFPKTDPHGDPIPSADGKIALPDSRGLTEVDVNQRFQLVRVLDQTPSFLRYLSDAGLPLGAVGEVLENSLEGGVITVSVEGNETTMSREVAGKLQVTAAVEVA